MLRVASPGVLITSVYFHRIFRPVSVYVRLGVFDNIFCGWPQTVFPRFHQIFFESITSRSGARLIRKCIHLECVVFGPCAKSECLFATAMRHKIVETAVDGASASPRFNTSSVQRDDTLRIVHEFEGKRCTTVVALTSPLAVRGRGKQTGTCQCVRDPKPQTCCPASDSGPRRMCEL